VDKGVFLPTALLAARKILCETGEAYRNVWKTLFVGLLVLCVAVVGIDTVAVSADRDGLSTFEEVVETGTDPLVADTDGDGLRDGREARLGIDPRRSDTDGDGLGDERELELRTDPAEADTDDDGLSDRREVTGETSATDPDTDGDRLKDGWEVEKRAPNGLALPGADPLHRDLYVDIVLLEDAPTVSPEEQVRLQRTFQRMPLENPDGNRGIRVHLHGPRRMNLTERELDAREPERNAVTETRGPRVEMATIDEHVYTSERMGKRKGIYHLVLVTPGVGGGGEAHGKIAKVGGQGDDWRRNHHILIHELLHTIVSTTAFGQDCHGRAHTCEGYLSYRQDTFFSEQTLEWLQRHAYAN